MNFLNSNSESHSGLIFFDQCEINFDIYCQQIKMEQLLQRKFLPDLAKFIDDQIGDLYNYHSSEYINDLVNCMKNWELILEMELDCAKIYSYKSHPEISVIIYSNKLTIIPQQLTLSDLYGLYSADYKISIKYNCIS